MSEMTPWDEEQERLRQKAVVGPKVGLCDKCFHKRTVRAVGTRRLLGGKAEEFKVYWMCGNCALVFLNAYSSGGWPCQCGTLVNPMASELIDWFERSAKTRDNNAKCEDPTIYDKRLYRDDGPPVDQNE